MDVIKMKEFHSLGEVQKVGDWTIRLRDSGTLSFSKDKEGYFVDIFNSNAFEPVSDTDFLVVSRFGDKKNATRIRLANGKIEYLYNQSYDACYELSDDLLLFETLKFNDDFTDVDTQYSFYSKKENQNLQKLNWLDGKYVISPVIADDDRVGIYIAKRIVTDNDYDFVKFTLDVLTLEPITEVYSTFSDRHIKVDALEDIQKIIDDDATKKEIADFYIASINEDSAKTKVKTLK